MNTVEDLHIDLAVVLGETRMPIHQLLRMGRGAIIEMDAHENDDVVILANNAPVAKGQVIVKGESISVSITKVLTQAALRRNVR